MNAIGQQHGRARWLIARAIGLLAFASLGLLMLGPDVARADLASGTITNSGGSSPRGKWCDTWSVTGIANGTWVTVEMRGAPTGEGTVGDPYVHVFNSSGVQMAADDDSGTGLNARLGITWQSGYYIGASVYSNNANQTYRLFTSHGSLAKVSIPCGPRPKSNQTITFNNPGTRTFGTSFTLSATATSGLAVSFSSSTTNVCTVSGTTLNTISTGTCTITASQSGDNSWNPASNVTQGFTIAKASQTITFGTLSNRTYSPTAFAISATATSGQAVTFTSQTSTICTVSGANVTMLASGTCTIRADQAGSNLYNAATSVDRSFAISQANQTISYSNPGQRFSQSTFTTSATASPSSLAVTFTSQTPGVCTTGGTNGTSVALVGVGTCTLRASQVGDSRYLAAIPVDQSFTAVPANQTITFTSPAGRTYGDADFAVSPTASSSLPVIVTSNTPGVCSVNGSTVSIRAAGSCTLVANQAGNTVYNAAPSVERTFTVSPKPLTAPSISIASRPYNGSLTAGVITLGSVSGLVGSEQLVITPSAGDYASENVGTRSSTVTFALANGSGGGIAANYSMAPVSVNGEITRRSLVVTAVDVARTADDASPNFSVSSVGLVPGESVSTATFSFVTVSAGSLVNGTPDHRIVGRYTVTPTGVTLANSRPANNYEIQFVSGDYRVTAGAPKRLVVPSFGGSAASGQAFTVQPRVTITDDFGNRIIAGAGSVATVNVAITAGSNGSLVGSTSVGAADGVAQFLNLGLAGSTLQSYTLTYTATVEGDSLLPATQTVAPSHGAATQLSVSAPITAQVSTPFASGVSVDVLDAQGNVVASSTARVTVVPSAGDLVGTKTVAATSGTVTFGGLTLNAPVGVYTLTYSSPGLASVTQSATVQAGPAARMELVTRAVGTRAGESFATPPAIRLTDSVGNPVLEAGNTVTATISRVDSTGALLVNGVESTTVSTQTDAFGVATFSGLGIVGLENTTYTITFSSTVGNVVIPTARQSITVTQGPAHALVVDRGVSGAASRVAATTQPRIKVLDRGGNLVTNPAEQVTVSASGVGPLVFVDAASVFSVGGYATFNNLAIGGIAGSHTIRYNIDNTSVSVDQSGVVLSAGPATQVVTTSATTTAMSGQPFTTSTVVKLIDNDGNVVTNSTVSVIAEVRSGNGSLIGTVTRPVINGSATFTGLGLRGAAGVYEIRYFVDGLAHASQTVTLGHGAPAKLDISTSGSGARAGSTLTTQPVIHVLDAEGNLVTSGSGSTAAVTVTSSIGSTLTGTTSVSAVGGVATFTDLRLDGRTGVSYALTFRSTVGSSTLTSASHNVTMATGDPVSLRLAQPAVGTRAGEVFTTQPQVEFLDVSGNLVTASNISVTVSVSSGATLSGATIAQASSGVATFGDLGISGTEGTYTLTFGSGTLTPVTQSVRVTPGAPVSLHLERSSSTSVGSGATLSVQPRIEIRDAAGNRVTDSPAHVTATVDGNATTVGSTRVGASSGLATFASFGLNGTAGTSYTVTYSSPGLSSVTQSVTVQVGAAVGLKLDTSGSTAGNSGVALGTQPVVSLRDSGNNQVTTSAVTVTATASTGGSIANATKATSNGVATFSGMSVTARTGTYTITYSAPNLAPVAQTITLNPGAAHRVVVDPQAKKIKTTDGAVIDLSGSVRIVDSAGNTVTSSNVQIEVSATTPQTTAVTGTACSPEYVGESNSKKVYRFTSTTACNWVVPKGVRNVDILAVGGGGGGGTDGGGGGGGGELMYHDAVSISEETQITVEVGNGGLGGRWLSPSRGASAGESTTISWGGTARYSVAGGSGGGGWQSNSRASGGSIGWGQSGAVFVDGGTGGGDTQYGGNNDCPSSPTVYSGTNGSAGPSTANSDVPLIPAYVGGGGGGGIAASSRWSNTTSGRSGGTGGGGSGASYTYDQGATAGANGQANTGGGGGGGAACDAYSDANQNGYKQRTSGGSGAAGVVYIAYATADADVGIKLSSTTSMGVDNTLSVNAVNGVLPLSTFRMDGRAYDYTLTYSGSGLVSDTQLVNVSPGTPSKIDDTVVAAGARSGDAFITQPVVAIQDASGNLVASSTATVSASVIGANAGAVTLGGTTQRAAVSGIATFTDLSLTGTAGSYTIEYSTTIGAQTFTTQATVTLEPGVASKLVTSGGSSVAAGSGIPSFSVNVSDASNNTVTSAVVDVGVEITSGPDGVLSGRTTVSAISGVATFSDLAIGGATGDYTLTFRSGSLSSTTRTITLTAGAPAYMTLSQFDSEVASGESMTPSPTVSFFDAFGNPASAATIVTATLQTIDIAGTSTGRLGSGTSTTALANGSSVTFGDVSVSGRAGQQYRIEFTASGLTPVTGVVSVSAGVPTSLVIVQEGADATSSLVLGVQPVVELRDSGNNLVTTSTDSVSMSSSTLTFGQGSTTALGGVATFAGVTVSGSTTITHTVTYSATIGSFTITSTQTLLVEAGTPVQLGVATEADGGQSGEAFATQPVLEIQDVDGNRVTTVNGSVSVAVSGTPSGTLLGDTLAPIVSGRAVFSSLGLSGRVGTDYTLTFSGTVSALNFSVADTVSVSAGAPASMVLTQGAAGAASGAPFSTRPILTILDEGGNTTSSNATVTASASVGGTLIGSTTVSAINGVADFADLGLSGTSGTTYTVTFVTDGLPPVAQTVTVTTGAPTRLEIVRGAAGARSGSVLVTAPQVRLVDSGGNAVATSGVTVSASISAGGSLGGTLAVETNGSGEVAFGDLVVNGTMGTEYTLTFSATYNGAALQTVSQNVRAQLGAASKVVLVNTPAGTESGVAFTTAPVLEVQDAGGNVIADSSATIVATVTQIDGAVGGVLVGTTERAAIGGVVSFTGLGISGTNGQTYRVTFSSNALQSDHHDVTVSTGPATHLMITSAVPTASAGVAFDPPMTVEILDSGGNVVSSNAQVVAAVNEDASFVGSTVVAATNGVATFADLGIMDTAGDTPMVTFSVAGVGSVSRQVTVSAGPASKLSIVGESGPRIAPSGGPFGLDPKIRIEDAGGNLVDDDATVVTASITQIPVGGVPTGVLVGSTTASSLDGVAIFGDLGITGRTGRTYVITYTASVNGQALASTSEAITVTTGTAVRLELTRPSVGNAVGEPFSTQPIVTVLDSGDNVVPSPGIDVRASVSSNGSLIGTTAVSAATGVATFNGLGIVGTASANYTITYTAESGSGPVGSIATVSQQITPRVGAASALVLHQSVGGAASGTPFATQPIVHVVDAGGNVVSSSNVPVTASVTPIDVNGAPTGVLSGTQTVNAADGVVRFTDLAITGKSNLAYTVTFTATLSGVPTTVTQIVQPSSGAAHSLGIVVPAAGAPSGVAFTTQPQIEVLDSAGNRALNSSRRVSVQVSTGGEFVGEVFADASAGLVTFSGLGLTGTAGTTYTLTFSSGAIDSVTQSVTVSIGPPTRLVITRPSAGTVAGSIFTTQPQLEIRDSGDNLVSTGSGSLLTVTAAIDPVVVGGDSTGAAIGSTTASGSGGVATFAGLGMGGRAGVDYTLRFTASFNGTNLTPATQTIRPDHGLASALLIKVEASGAVVGEPLAVQPRISVIDAFGNLVANGTDIVTASISDGASLVGSTSRAAVGGEVVFTDLSARGVASTAPVITYSAAGLTSVTQSVTMLAGAPTRLMLDQPAIGAASGRDFTTAPRIVIADSFGNRTNSSATVSATITQVAGAGVLTGTRELTASNGEVTFADLGIDGRAGTSYTIRFSSLGLSGVSQTIQVELGQPTSIEFIRRSIGASVGVVFAQQPVLVLRDAGGNVVTNSNATVSASVDELGGSLIGTTTIGLVNGFASFTDLGIMGAQQTNYTVRYTSGTLSATQVVLASTGPALSLQLVTTSAGQTDGAVFTTQPRLALRDAAGNLVVETGANVTATLAGPNGVLIGTTTRPVISGVAAYTNLGIDGTPDQNYVITYSSAGLFSVTESITVSAAAPGLVPQFATVSATVDGFSVDMTNFDASFTTTGVASAGGRVSTVDLGGGTRRFIVTGIGPDTPARLTVTTSKAGHTTETAFVDARSQLRFGLIPQFASPTDANNFKLTNDGFSVQITNFNSSYIWTAQSSAGGRSVISPTGRLTVSGLGGGVTVSATVTTARAGFQSASASTPSVTTLQAPLIPTFGAPVAETGGFTVQVTNFDPAFSYSTFITPAGSVTISASGLVTVGGLANGTTATVLVTTSRSGHSNGSGAVIGRSLGSALTPSFGTPEATADGWSVVITNYDAAFTWSPSVDSGTAQLSVVGGVATVNLTTPSGASTLTVSTSRTGFLSGAASVSFAREVGLVPRFGVPTPITGGFTVPIVNYDADYAWSVTSTNGTATIGTDGTVTVSASSATITVTSARVGHATRSASFTKGSSSALVPNLATVSASLSGFVIDITNHDPSYSWTVATSRGSASTSPNGRITVTGLTPGQSAEVVVYSDKLGHDTGNAAITMSADLRTGLTPILGTAIPTADGFAVDVSNYDPAYTWTVQAASPALARLVATGATTARVTVEGIEGGSSATITVTARRSGYADGTAERTGTALDGGGLLPVFDLPTSTADGFVVSVANHSNDWTWQVSATTGSAVIDAAGEITVDGVSPGDSSTVTVQTSRIGRLTRSVTFTASALDPDGAPTRVAGRVPTFGPVTPTADGFTVRITNHSSGWTWSAISGRGVTVNVSSLGVLTVSGLAPGLLDTVLVTTDATGFATGTAVVQGSSLASGARAANLLSDVTMTALCPNGSPDGEGAFNLNDLLVGTRYSCYTAASRAQASLTPNTIGFATGDLGTSVLTSITFTSAPDVPDRDPLTYTLWGCQAENQYCSIIVSNDSTGLTTARQTDSTRTFRNTRAFNFYRVTFGSMRGSSNVVQLSEVSFGGTSGLPAGLLPTFATPTVSANGFTVDVTNFSRLYTWQVSVPAPGRAAIDANGLIRVENLAPNSTTTLTVTTRRTGFADATTTLTVSTNNGASLIPAITSVEATEDGLRALVENYDTPGFTWAVSTSAVGGVSSANPGVASLSSSGIVTVTGATPGSTVRLTISTSRSGYLPGSTYVDETVLNDLGIVQFAPPTPLTSGFTVQVTNFATSDANGTFEWRVTADSGAIAAIDNSGLVTVSNLGSGASARVTVVRSQVGALSTSGSIVGRAIGTLVPEFRGLVDLEDGFVVDVANFDPLFTWTATASAGTVVADWSVGRVTVSAVPSGVNSVLTVSTSRTGFIDGSASVGSSLDPAVIPVFATPTEVGTGFTTSITNWSTVSATTWVASVSPAGSVLVDGAGNVTVSGAVRGEATTVTVTTAQNGRLNGRGSVIFTVGARPGLTPSFGASIPIAGGYTVQIVNFNPDFTWSALTAAGSSVSVSATGLVTVLDDEPGVPVTVTVFTSRTGHQAGQASVTGSSRLRPGLIPVFGTPTVSGTGVTVQIENYDPAYSWTAAVDNNGLVSISSTGRVTVTDLPGFTMATIVVTTTRAGFTDQTGTVTATTLAGEPLVPRFTISTSTADGYSVRLRNFDPRYDWFVSSPLPGVVGDISADGLLTVSGATAGALVPIEVRTERAGFQSGLAEFSAVARPTVANTIGPIRVQQYQVASGVVTVDTQTPHGFAIGDWIVVANLGPTLDGDYRVTSVPSATQFTYGALAADTVSTDVPIAEVEGDGSTRPTDGPTDSAPDQGEFDNSQPVIEGEGPVAQSVLGGSIVVQSWVVPSQPAFVQLSETTVPVDLNDDEASELIRAFVTIPSRVASDGASMTVIAAMTEEAAAGYHMVRIDGASGGLDVTQLSDVVRILFEPPAPGAVPVQSSDDGLTWEPLPRLSSPFLPEGLNDGYYPNEDGTYWVYTRHLSFFGFLALQAVPLDIVGLPSSLQPGSTAQITVVGGEGEGDVELTSLTPSTCTVDGLGYFTAVSAGTCSLRATKDANGRFLQATSVLTYSIGSTSTPPGGDVGGGVGDDTDDDTDEDDESGDDDTPIDDQPDTTEPDDGSSTPGGSGPSRPGSGSSGSTDSGSSGSSGSGGSGSTGDTTPPSQSEIDAVSEQTRTPLPPGSGSPVVDRNRPVVVIEDGEIVDVDVESAPDGNGLIIRGPSFEVLLRGFDADGNPLPLDGDLRLVVERGQLITITGGGYAPNSIVSVFLFSSPVKLGEARTDENGNFSATFTIPEDIEPGDHTVQINGVSPDGALRTLNVLVDVTDSSDESDSNATVIVVVIVVIALMLTILIAMMSMLRIRRRRPGEEISAPDASS